MRGLTLIELAISIGLGVILIVMAVPIYGKLQVSAQLNEQTALIVQLLRSTRELSIAGYNGKSHGIFFNIDPAGPDSYTVYQGLSYAVRDTAYDRKTAMDGSLSFANSNLVLTGSDIDINFSRSSGIPNNIGSFFVNHSVAGQKIIAINSLGAVVEN